MSTHMGNGTESSIAAVQVRIQDEAGALSRTAASIAAADDAEQSNGVNFTDALEQAIQGVEDKEQTARDAMAAVDSGKSDDLVGAMLKSQEASLSFSMLVQMRNKVVGAMDELLKLSL